MKSSATEKIFAVIGVLMALQSGLLSLTIVSALLTGHDPEFPIYHSWIEAALTGTVAVCGVIGNIGLFRMKRFFPLCLAFIIADLLVSLHSMYTFSLMSSAPPTLGVHTILRWVFGIAYLSIIWKAKNKLAQTADNMS